MKAVPANRRYAAVKLTRELLNTEGLGHVFVELSDRARTRAGACMYRQRQPYKISLSTWLVDRASWEQVEDTIRHEVAHAVVGGGKGHGREWKQAARRLGAKAERCYSTAAMYGALPKHRWVGVCPNCGHVYKRHRRSFNVYHTPCGPVEGKINWKEAWA